MKRLGVAVLGLLFALIAIPAVLATQVTFAPIPPFGTSDVHGAYHVHSRRSDGRGTDEEIASAAEAAGLSFVLLTDHNLSRIPEPRFVHGVLLLWGTEISTKVGHLVALGLPRALTLSEQEGGAVDAVQALGGQAYLAHPVQNHWPWQDWEAAERAQGLELFSGDTALREALERPFSRLLPALGAYLGQPLQGLYSLLEDEPTARARLLSLVRADHPMVALCGLDAHGIPPYAQHFRTLQVHLGAVRALPTDAGAAARAVFEAISARGSYCGMDGLGSAAGFSLGVRRSEAGGMFRVHIPATQAPVQVRVWGPAHVLPDGVTVSLDGVGAVQVEVWLQARDLLLRKVWKPWIVPSPFWVQAQGNARD